MNDFELTVFTCICVDQYLDLHVEYFGQKYFVQSKGYYGLLVSLKYGHTYRSYLNATYTSIATGFRTQQMTITCLDLNEIFAVLEYLQSIMANICKLLLVQ